MSRLYEGKLRHAYDKYEFAMMCGESIDELIKLANTKKLPFLISRKKINGDWVFQINSETFTLIKGLRHRGVNQVIRLLTDASANHYLWQLKRDVNSLDLSSYY